jgi:CO dehydrogenase maturation factor
MKILVCGKGGCGKSTAAALLAREMGSRGKRVLLIDSDESNFGLHSMLGMERPKDFMDYFGGKKVLFEKVKSIQRPISIDELPRDYIAGKGNIKLLAMGKIYDFGEGCACPINALSSRFLENIEIGKDELLIADTDAGVEHLGRGVEHGCDVILIVVEPSRESIEMAARIVDMASSLEKRLYYVLNKIEDETRSVLMSQLDQDRIIASIPRDERIFKIGLSGGEMDVKLDEVAGLADVLQRDAE